MEYSTFCDKVEEILLFHTFERGFTVSSADTHLFRLWYDIILGNTMAILGHAGR